MTTNPFENNEMCDGKNCRHKNDCARYMGRCDLDRCNLYVVFNKTKWPICCPYFLDAPDPNYPGAGETPEAK